MVDIIPSSASRRRWFQRVSVIGPIAVALILAGCSTRTYVWTRDPRPTDVEFKVDQLTCRGEANAAYIPLVAGTGPRWTLYKDCMEKKGYVKQGRQD